MRTSFRNASTHHLLWCVRATAERRWRQEARPLALNSPRLAYLAGHSDRGWS